MELVLSELTHFLWVGDETPWPREANAEQDRENVPHDKLRGAPLQRSKHLPRQGYRKKKKGGCSECVKVKKKSGTL